MRFYKYFSVFERALWCVSVITIVVSFLLPENKDILTLISSLIGVTALIFLAKGNVIGQMLIVVFAVFYGIVSFFFHYYGEMITYLCMSAPIALISVFAWLKHPSKKAGEVAVGALSKKGVVLLFLLSLIVTIIFYPILAYFDTANLIFSTLSVATSFLAASLSALRSPYYALAYAANDAVLIVLWVMASIHNISYLPMVACFVMFLINDLYGFYNWLRMRKRQRSGF